MSVSSLINTEIFTWLSFFLTYLIENVLSLDGTIFEGMFVNGKRNGYGRESNR